MATRLGNVLFFFGLLCSVIWYGMVVSSYYHNGPVVEPVVMILALGVGAVPFLIGMALSYIISGQ